MDDMEHDGGGSDAREDHHRSPPHHNEHGRDSDDDPSHDWRKGQCGIQGNRAVCPQDKPCCDQNGMCALSEEACGHGCQPHFGACLASRSPPTTGNTSGGDTGSGGGNANNLQAGTNTDSQSTTITPVTAAIVGASAFVAGVLFAILLFVAAKKRTEKAGSSDERNRKDVVEVAAEEDDLDNNNDDGDQSMAGISSLYSTPTFGTLGNDGYPDGGDDENDDADYVLSPNSTMVDAEEDNDIRLNLDEGGWQTAIERTSGRTDAFGQDANLAALEQHLYNAESRQQAQSYMPSVREEMYSDHDIPFDETHPLEQQPPPASKRDRYFDYNDSDDFLGPL